MLNITEIAAVGLVGATLGLGLGMVLARSGTLNDMAAAGAYGRPTPPASKRAADIINDGPAVQAASEGDAESARIIAATLQTFVDGWNAHDRARMAPIFPEHFIDLTVADPVIHGPTQTDRFLTMAEQSGSHLAITQQALWVSGDVAADYGLVEQTAPRTEGEAGAELEGVAQGEGAEGEGAFEPYRLRYINVWRRSAADGWRIYWSMEIPEPTGAKAREE